MSVKTCQICGKLSGIYPLCREHLILKNEGKVIKNEETSKWELVEETETKQSKKPAANNAFFDTNTKNLVYNDKCIICESNSNGKTLCYSCYKECIEMESEVDKNSKPFELKDYYYNLKSANYRVVNKKNIVRNLKMMYALANVNNKTYNDTSLTLRLENDIKECIEYTNKKKEVKTTEYTEKSDSQKSAILRTLDGHIVKSRGESVVDDILFNNMLCHCYEKDVIEISSIERTVKSDWFIPVAGNRGIYIEYWGMDTDSYNKNKEEKRKKYQENNLCLIEIEKDDVQDVHGLTARIMREYKKFKDQIKESL